MLGLPALIANDVTNVCLRDPEKLIARYRSAKVTYRSREMTARARQQPRCNCGRFMRRVLDGLGLPLSTGFPPDRPDTASTFPWQAWGCKNTLCLNPLGMARTQYFPAHLPVLWAL